MKKIVAILLTLSLLLAAAAFAEETEVIKTDKKLIKYSNDRDDKFGICTTIEKENDGYIVKKRAVSDASLAHIAAPDRKTIKHTNRNIFLKFILCSSLLH